MKHKRRPGQGHEVEGDAAQLIEEANTHWEQRQDVTHLEKALELYEQAATIDQQNLDLFIDRS